jgi:hypothetical protein
LTSLPSGVLKLFGEALQFHQLLETLVYGEAKVVADQGAIDVLLVGLDYGIAGVCLVL